MKQLAIQFAADHPVGAGHFPGNPIIPGALLLAEVLRRISDEEGLQPASCSVKSAKFQHPARPGERIDIEYSMLPSGVIDFKCAVSGVRVLSGAISVADQI